MAEHTRVIRPSGLSLLLVCPGSWRMQQEVPPVADSDEELEGQAAHLVAMGVASKRWEPRVGDKFPHAGRDWEIDDDMLDGALLYAEEAQFHRDARYEDPVDARYVIPDCYGTPDYWRAYEAAFGVYAGADTRCETRIHLKVVDYKYGFRHVEVFENSQLIAYALGVQGRLQLPWDTPVCLTIVQPRSYHHEGPVREWRETDGQQLTLQHLYHYALHYIVPAVVEAQCAEPRTISGPHCVDCQASHLFPTYRKSTSNVLQYVGKAQPEQMSPQAVGVELRLVKWAIKMLEGREAGLKAHAEACINAGVQVPYWRMGSAPGRLAWAEGFTAEQRIAWGMLFGVDLSKPSQTITPTQAIKQKGLAESVVHEYASRPRGPIKLIPDDEKQFRKAFGHASK